MDKARERLLAEYEAAVRRTKPEPRNKRMTMARLLEASGLDIDRSSTSTRRSLRCVPWSTGRARPSATPTPAPPQRDRAEGREHLEPPARPQAPSVWKSSEPPPRRPAPAPHRAHRRSRRRQDHRRPQGAVQKRGAQSARRGAARYDFEAPPQRVAVVGRHRADGARQAVVGQPGQHEQDQQCGAPGGSLHVRAAAALRQSRSGPCRRSSGITPPGPSRGSPKPGAACGRTRRARLRRRRSAAPAGPGSPRPGPRGPARPGRSLPARTQRPARCLEYGNRRRPLRQMALYARCRDCGDYRCLQGLFRPLTPHRRKLP